MNCCIADAFTDSFFPAHLFTRRGFLVTSLGAGFALAVQPVMAQTAIHTDSAGLTAGGAASRSRLGITGFCWGGRITWLYAAHNPQVRAGVACYGRLVGAVNEFTPRHPSDVVGQLKAPVLGLYGGLDTGIPLATVEAMEKKLQEAANPAARASEIVLYDNAPHAFHADYRPSYRKAEAEDGRRRPQFMSKHRYLTSR